MSSTTLDTLALAVAKSNKAGLGTAWTTKEDLCLTSVGHVKLGPAAGAVEAEVISLSSTVVNSPPGSLPTLLTTLDGREFSLLPPCSFVGDDIRRSVEHTFVQLVAVNCTAGFKSIQSFRSSEASQRPALQVCMQSNAPGLQKAQEDSGSSETTCAIQIIAIKALLL